MPITLPPITRRRFLGQTAALAGVAGLPQLAWGMQDETPDPHRVALFSDTHIDKDPAETAGRDPINMTDYFARCIRAALRGRPPGQAFVCGDCAYQVGEHDDYLQFMTLTVALLERGVPVHCVLGNHDNTNHFFEAGVAAEPDNPPVRSKHVGVVETPRANWLLLDSLKETDYVPGELGEDQLAWIAETLDALDDKPVLVMVHHTMEWIRPDGQNWGLLDSGAMLDVLSSRRKVKALFFGHSHDWQHSQRDDGIHMVNLPPTAYVFEHGKPNGWIDCAQAEDGLTLTLNCVDRRRSDHGEQVELAYR